MNQPRLLKKLPLSLRPLFDFLAKMLIFTTLLWTAVDFFGFTSHSVFYAWLCIALNTLVGYALVEVAFHQNGKEFFRVVLLGQAARFLIVLCIIALLLMNRLVVREEFVWALLGCYLFYLPLEIFAGRRKVKFENKLEKLTQS